MNPCVATVGTFDGFHRGHAALVQQVVDIAGERGLDSRVITFIGHPLEVIAPDRVPSLVSDRSLALMRIEGAGVGRVSQINFTPALAALTARQFLALIRDRYGVKVLVMGYDNSFGSDCPASRQDYIDAGEAEGVEIIFGEPLALPDGTIVSSSQCRKAIAEGDIDRFTELSGHPLIVGGTVVRGKQNGRKLGFPTMNLDMGRQQSPRPGVYSAAFLCEGAGGRTSWLPAVLNIGNNPTFADDNPITWELHVPHRNLGNMYGRKVVFCIGPRLRDEQKFATLTELKKAIRRDVDMAVKGFVK